MPIQFEGDIIARIPDPVDPGRYRRRAGVMGSKSATYLAVSEIVIVIVISGACKDIQPTNNFGIYSGEDDYRTKDGVRIIFLPAFLEPIFHLT